MAEHWFRSYHGAPMDAKWIAVGRRADVAPGMVAALWWALMDHASQATPRGSVTDFDVESAATFFGWDETQCNAVVVSLREKRLIDKNGYLKNWQKRNPKREDSSTERVRKHRLNKKLQANAEGGNENRNAVERDVTPEERRGEVSVSLKKEREKQKQRIPTVRSLSQPPPSWSRSACDIWSKNMGGKPPGGRIGKDLKPLVTEHGEAEVLGVWDAYLAGHVREGRAQFANSSDFAAKYGLYREHDGLPPPNGRAARGTVEEANERLIRNRLALEQVPLNPGRNVGDQ